MNSTITSWAEAHAANYEPRAGDAARDEFADRMTACESCSHRVGGTCEALNILCSVQARNKVANCPHRHWAAGKPAQSSPRIRVAFLSPSMYPGGAERWMISLARWLPQCGPVEVLGSVITSQGLIDAGMRSEHERYAPVVSLTESHAEAQQILSAADVVLVWGIGPLAQYVASLQARIVWVAHGSCQWTAEVAATAAPAVTHWAGVADMTRRSLPESVRDQMTVIHNGADIERCVPILGRAETRRRWGVRDDQYVVGYIGRFSPEKRPTAVAEALRHLPANYIGVMVGSGWKAAETTDAVNRTAPGRVLFPGYTSHVGDALSAVDVWVNCSPAEGFSLSLCEAWLAGVPVVTTPTGAVPELRREHGWLVEEVPIGADGATIAAAIRATVELQYMGGHRARADRARDIAWNTFTAPAMARRWAEYLERIMRPPTEPSHPAVPPSIWGRICSAAGRLVGR